MTRTKKILTGAGAALALTGAAVVAPSLDATHDHEPPAASAHAHYGLSNECNHTWESSSGGWWIYYYGHVQGNPDYHLVRHTPKWWNLSQMFGNKSHWWTARCH